MNEQPTNEIKCPKCGANTVEKSSFAYPPYVSIIVWCGCGYEAEVKMRMRPMPKDDLLERWKKANQ